MRDPDPIAQRRALFGNDVVAYDDGRPGYPDRVFDLLRTRCGLGPGVRVLEIGPGTGQATRRLVDAGASVTAVELSTTLADQLRANLTGRDLVVAVSAFEDFEPTPGSFDLVTAATSWHWMPAEASVRRSAQALRPQGWLAVWWAIFGDPDRPDPFHDALTPVLEELEPELVDPIVRSDRHAPGTGAHPYGLDTAARIVDLEAAGYFVVRHHEVIPWTGRHTAPQLRAMFASFSPWLALPEDRRRVLLNRVEQLADEQFGGRVERPYLTPIYLARRTDTTTALD